MAITVTKEDGTGLAGANSYVAVADADAYHAQNFHTATKWAALTADQKAMAVITATRILDQQWQWNGFKMQPGVQALQWPRGQCPDPDSAGYTSASYPLSMSRSLEAYMPDNEVPDFLARAVNEMAAAVSSQNFESAPSGEGLTDFTLEGVMSVSFNLATKPGFFPAWISAECAKYGHPLSGSSRQLKLVRT